MSVHVLSWVLRNSGATLGDRLVLLVLADHARGEDGAGAWPSVRTIAQESRLSERQVQRALRSLEAAGEIQQTGTTRQGVNVYRVLMGGGRQDVTPDVDVTRGATPTSPESSLEPSVVPTPSEANASSGVGAQEIVGAYIDYERAAGYEPPRRVVGMLARNVGELLGEGQSPEAIVLALKLMSERRLHPSTLPTLIAEAVKGPPEQRRARTQLELDYERLRGGSP